MRPIDPAGFERKFQEDDDPWDYRTSRFEAFKRGVLLAACGASCHGRGLELACANGETTLRLAPHCLRLTAVDSSATALAAARQRLGDRPGVELRQAVLPDGFPRGPFDLIVASEIVYYLPAPDLEILLDGLERALAPGGRAVLLHHLRAFDDAAQHPARAQATARKRLERSMARVFVSRHARFEAVAYIKPRR